MNAQSTNSSCTRELADLDRVAAQRSPSNGPFLTGSSVRSKPCPLDPFACVLTIDARGDLLPAPTGAKSDGKHPQIAYVAGLS